MLSSLSSKPDLKAIKEKAPHMTQDELKQAGNKRFQEKLFEEAIDLYTLAIEKDACCDAAVPILSNRSLCYFNIGKYKEAYEDGGCCCGIKPDWAKGFMRRGVAAEKLEEWQIALESYDEYLKLDPSDEFDVRCSRKVVAAAASEQEKRYLGRKNGLAALDQQLLYLRDTPDQHLLFSYFELFTGCTGFDIERMKIALKQDCNPRIDTPILRKFFEGRSSGNNLSIEAFYPENLKAARDKLVAASGKLTNEIALVAQLLVTVLGLKTRFESVPTARQVEYLDLILDAADEQNFDGVAESMEDPLRCICWYDPTISKHSSVRKDLIITLFNRIDTSRRFFLGNSPSATNKDFATAVLSALCSNFDQKMAGSAADVCSRDMYECICTAMEHGACPNKILKWSRLQKINRGMSAFSACIANLRSVRVMELLLRHGADVNLACVLDEVFTTTIRTSERGDDPPVRLTCPRTPLCIAFKTFRTDLVRALLAYGAQFPSEPMPDFALKLCFRADDEPDSSLIKRSYTSHFYSAMLGMSHPDFPSENAHEYLQLLFETVTDQGLSLSFPSSRHPKSITNPLEIAILTRIDINIIETMIRMKPGLVKLASMVSYDDDYRNGIAASETSPLAVVIYQACQYTSDDPHKAFSPVTYMCSVARLLSKYGVDFYSKKDVAFRNVPTGAVDEKTASSATAEELVNTLLACRDQTVATKMRKFKKAMKWGE